MVVILQFNMELLNFKLKYSEYESFFEEFDKYACPNGACSSRSILDCGSSESVTAASL